VIDDASEACLTSGMKKRLTSLIFVLVIDFLAAPLRAEDAPCCATGTSAKKTMCADYAKLNLNPEQKTKLAALQKRCMKDGCTEKSRAKFLESAKRILSTEQYAGLKAECAKTEKKQS
jgi:hypothetical protein